MLLMASGLRGAEAIYTGQARPEKNRSRQQNTHRQRDEKGDGMKSRYDCMDHASDAQVYLARCFPIHQKKGHVMSAIRGFKIGDWVSFARGYPMLPQICVGQVRFVHLASLEIDFAGHVYNILKTQIIERRRGKA